MATVDDGETLRRFVVRARRVKAHSLVQDWDGLLGHADGGFNAHLAVSGRMTVTRRLPADEELFESLASRVRPVTFERESVHYTKVLDAIERALNGTEVDETHHVRLGELRRAWDATAKIQGTQIQGYALQIVRADGSAATEAISDTQLAAGWMYADLVHTDPTGPKADALAVPLRERYAAAVRVFSRMAALVVETLEFIELLRDADVLAVDQSAWQVAVVVGASDLTEEARVFVGSVDAEMPDLRQSLEMPDGWRSLTVTELLRQDAANHVRVVLRDDDGTAVVSYDAAVARRRVESQSAGWDVLVAGSMLFMFSFDLEDEKPVDAQFVGWEAFDSTNELKLASSRLMLEMDGAASVVFEVCEHEFLTVNMEISSEEKRRELEVVAQTLEDLVAIERITGQELEPCLGSFDDRERVHLRRTRLMLEGHVVRGPRVSVRVTSPNGNPPKFVVVPARSLDVGGAIVPVPQSLIRHPGMAAVEVARAPDAGPEAKIYDVAPPDGEQFLMWFPERVEVLSDDDLTSIAPWGLIDIDEDKVTY